MSYAEPAVHKRILNGIGAKENSVQLVERTDRSEAGTVNGSLSPFLARSILHMNLAYCSLLEA